MKNLFLISGERILLIGLFFTPFTSLRFGFMGIGELLILISGLIGLCTCNIRFKLDVRIKIFYQFWLLFLLTSLLGLFFNHFLLNFPSGTIEQMLFDLFSYSFILFTVFIVGHYGADNRYYAETLFTKLFVYWGIAFVSLFIISFYTGTIFGLPLRYNQYFSPLVENVHQAAMVTSAMTFIMLFLYITSNQLFKKFFFLLCSVLFGAMAITSGSTKAMLGIVVGIILGLSISILYRNSGKYKLFVNTGSFLFSFAFILILIFLYSSELIFLAVQFFTENDGGGSRQTLYRDGFMHGLNSFVVGHGPGAHVPYKNTFWDAHNSTLTIFLQSGLLGVILFVWFNTKMLLKTSINFALFGAIAAIGMYIIGGDVLRRLPIWIMLMALYYFSINQSLNLNANNQRYKKY